MHRRPDLLKIVWLRKTSRLSFFFSNQSQFFIRPYTDPLHLHPVGYCREYGSSNAVSVSVRYKPNWNPLTLSNLISKEIAENIDQDIYCEYIVNYNCLVNSLWLSNFLPCHTIVFFIYTCNLTVKNWIVNFISISTICYNVQAKLID